jgi:hypothetical protein
VALTTVGQLCHYPACVVRAASTKFNTATYFNFKIETGSAGLPSDFQQGRTLKHGKQWNPYIKTKITVHTPHGINGFQITQTLHEEMKQKLRTKSQLRMSVEYHIMQSHDCNDKY